MANVDTNKVIPIDKVEVVDGDIGANSSSTQPTSRFTYGAQTLTCLTTTEVTQWQKGCEVEKEKRKSHCQGEKSSSSHKKSGKDNSSFGL
ncbi:uncharacterized protein HKW66_Vig0103460 [Vigna angularis]|uniref:Uncharacterized protein n=1 Tax=Phaseolus angularis TaxID=3914 RepID=A0A8T0KJZ9_PHAAN|nr:uncharacterized protein HKW66_Vig0103460 [Vigna angularis]